MESIRRESSRMSRSSVQSHGKSSTVSGAVGSSPNRPSLLSKAYHSVSTRGSRMGNRNSWQEPTQSDQKAAFSGISGYGVDGEGKQKHIQGFDGIFPVPHPDCKPTQPANLTEEQQKKYQEVFEYFKSQKDFPVSLKPEEKRREPLSDWEKLRLLSKESMLRYLRATKWDVRQAKKRLVDTIAWRREFGVESLNPEEMAKEAKCGKETVLGYDKHARPVHYMHPHRSDTKESPRQMQFAVFLLERCIDMMPPGVEQLALLINFEHKSRNPTSIANAKLMLYILQNHYVENLGVNWSVNVPWVFKVFWNAIQPFIDPVTKNKCHFDEPVRNQVPADQLSTDFGGDVKAKYDHDAYWPALLRITKERRDEMVRRFKEDCNSEIGASEWVIRGGDDPTSPFSAHKSEAPVHNGHESTATSTDNSSSVATPTAIEMRDSSPLELFKTPLDQLNKDPLERTFSSTTQSSDAHHTQKQTLEAPELATTAEKPKEEEEETKKAEKEEQNSQMQTPKSSSPQSHTASTLFKDKLHASKLFAAFHPDSRRSASQDQPRSSNDATESQKQSNGSAVQTESEEPISPTSETSVPAPHEILAVAGAAGPQAAAGAVGSIVADQAYYGMQRVKSTAETNLSKLTSGAQETSSEVATGAPAADQLPPSLQGKSVTILFFAAAKEAVGGKAKHLLLLPTDGTSAVTLSALRDHILITFEKDPPSEKYDGASLKKVIEGSKWSIDESMIDEDELQSTLIQGGETVAIIPPVSGG
ncbi:hypothetical protein L7F22_042106 [Adiantum nelumboides]|nr:hypothetical protein [Adiantum nelumboides]